MNTSPIAISALRHLGAEPHRIEWFGQIYRSATANVAVVFSPWRTDSETGEMRSDAGKRVSTLIPVAFLRLFRIGDVWESGHNTGRRDVPTRETFHLELHEKSVKVMPAGVPLNDDPRNLEYPLPFSMFGGHTEHTQAQCARIQLDENSTLVIPCMELVRFYFGASGSFLKRLFSGAFALDRLFTKARLSPNTRAANIDLAEDLSGTAAATVARIAFDAQARSAAAWIVNSAIASTANKDRYYPKTTFPFFGETDLTVDGRWIEQKDHRVFLVEQLVRCTHPFPFETLFYSTSKSPLSNRKLYGPPDSAKPDTGNSAEIPERPDMRLDEQSVSSFLLPIGIPADEEDEGAFPDLAQKKIRRVKQTTSHVPPDRGVEELTELATGDETSSSEVRAAEVMVDMEDSTFDDASIDELPSEATEMFKEAFGAYMSASPGHYLLAPAEAGTTFDPMMPGPFLRGDFICQDGDKRLEHIWSVVIETSIKPYGRALVMIRGNVTRDYDDHLLLVRINPLADIRTEVQRYCSEFARDCLSEQLKQNVLLVQGTESAVNLYSLLRGLSMSMQLLHSGRTEPMRPLDEATRLALAEPLISKDELLTILRKARRND